MARGWMFRLTNRESASWAGRVLPLRRGGAGWPELWSVATDKRGLLAVQDGGREAEPVAPAGRPEPARATIQTIRDLLDREPGDCEWTTLGDLWAWLGDYRRHRCPTCYADDGTVATPYCPDECDDGWWPGADVLRVGVVAGVPVNADLLCRYLPADLLEFDPDGRVRVGRVNTLRNDGRSVVGPAVIIERPGVWRLVLMGLCDPFGGFPADEWRVYRPGCGAFGGAWDDRHPGPVAADWFEERGDEKYAAVLRREAAGEG